MLRKPLITVIIPIYNGKDYLYELIESIINQTYSKFQLICVNDGSTDNTEQILEKFKSRDDRIEIYTQDNLGAGAARNLGLRYARGEYISILDSDDILNESMFEKMVENAINFDSDIVICKALGFSNKCKNINIDYSLNMKYIKKYNYESFNIDDIPDKAYNFCFGWTWDKLFKKSFIDDKKILFQELHRADDLFFTFYAISVANKISIVDDYLIMHRYHKNQSSITREQYMFDFYEAIVKLYDELNKIGLYKKIKPSFIYWLSRYCVWQYSSFTGRNQKIMRGFLRNTVFKKFDILCPENIFLCDRNKVEIIKEIMWDYNIRNKPLVSVIVVGYNIEKYINTSINSVINQTYENIEILLIDDGSKDNTKSIMKTYAESDLRVKFFDFENNSCGGIGTVGNFGIDNANGEYIIFCDGDDWLSLTAIEDFLKIMLKEKSDFVYSKNQRFDNKKNKIIPHYDNPLWENLIMIKDMDEIKRLLFLMGAEPWKKMYSKQFLKSKNIRFPIGDFFYEDMPFHIQCTILASKISILNKTTYYYRINRQGATITRNDNSKLKVYTHLLMLLEWMKKEKILSKYKDIFLIKALRSMAFIREGLNIKGIIPFYKLTKNFYKNFSVVDIKSCAGRNLYDYKAIPLSLAARGKRFLLFCLFLLYRRGA